MNDIICQIKDEINYQIDNFPSLDKIRDIILKCQGNVYTTGVGKSGILCKLLSDLLKSISVKSFYLDPLNLLHGDIGSMNGKDILIIFSKSGKTKEIEEILHFINQREVKIIEICCERRDIANIDIIFKIPLKSEIKGEIESIPSNSIMSYILFINILIADLKKSISLEKYKENHPYGSIGKGMKKVSEIMIHLKKCCILDKDSTLKDGIIGMNLNKMGVILVTKNGEVFGIITDRDIRNYLETRDDISINLEILTNRNFFYIENLNTRLKDINKKYNFIPVIKNNKFLGLVKCNN